MGAYLVPYRGGIWGERVKLGPDILPFVLWGDWDGGRLIVDGSG